MFLAQLALAPFLLVILAELVHLTADALLGQTLQLLHLALLAQDHVLEVLHLVDRAPAYLDLLRVGLHTLIALRDERLLLVRSAPASAK